MSSKHSVLIVDDEVLIARDLRSRLQNMGYQVVDVAYKARESVQKAATLKPDLVLMDINLRDDLDGVDAACQIRDELNIPVVFASAYSNEDTLKRATTASPYGFLLKPFDNRELEIVIEIALFKHLSEKDLKDSRLRLDATLSNLHDGLIAVNPRGEIDFINPAAEMMIGTCLRRMQRPRVEAFVHLDPYTTGGESAQFIKGLEPWRDVRGLRQILTPMGGEKLPVEISVNSFKAGHSTMNVITMRDISEQVRLEEAIKENALYDEVTHLPNRSLFVNRLEGSINRRRRSTSDQFAVLFMDLDGFGVINEGLGHERGDELMKIVAERIRETLRPDDTVSRFSGDIFAVLLDPVDSANGAITACQRIQSRIAEPIELADTLINTSVTVGIALGVDADKTAEELLRDANNALNRAKTDNKGGYMVFDTEMYRSAMHFIDRKAGLQEAIVQNGFEVHYQPIVDLSTERFVSMEALVRWPHPRDGWVSPAEFIPIAEKTGLIVPLGEWVLRRVCRQICEWNDSGFRNFRVAVNLSARQFEGDIANTVRELINEFRIAPRSLGLEITEGVAMENVEQNVAKLHELRNLGLNLSIDDFGTGYSSLAYLTRFPINTLKIDRAFVCNIANNSDDLEIVRAIIAMGRSLGLKVLAEGVEDHHQVRLLRNNGCDYIQGYYYSRPLPADEIVRHLRQDALIGQEHMASVA